MPYQYILIFVLLIMIELLYFKLADHFNIIDKPNLRSSHSHITLRGGGIIFLFGIWLYAIFFGFQYVWFLLGLTILASVSFIDDIHSVPNKIRLFVQFVSMFLMFYEFGILNWQSWYIVLISVIISVGILNAYNFMDGINGITGGYSLVVLSSLLLANCKFLYIDQQLIFVVLLSVLVFCFFNFRKRAKCFAGDVGSIGIAFIILFILGKLILQTNDITYLIFLSVYGVDSVLTIIHRIILHENLGEAHRKHAFQIMANELKMSHVLVSSLYMFLQLIISVGAMFLPINKWLYFCVTIILLSVAYIIFMKRYYCLHEEYLRNKKALK